MQLSIGTLVTVFGGSYAAMGGKKKEGQQGPPINAKDQDEEKFIQYVKAFGREDHATVVLDD